ncbi:olfactory receptor 52E4-like [Platichthys flesus]|uniref:olfactory receptor 52E4-like n=1 Tax=Platichthys flesus TaxID=8260 RepID=UPI002DBC632D|nr:olfactory receptor 52E4-like [Platichthys flesus]
MKAAVSFRLCHSCFLENPFCGVSLNSVHVKRIMINATMVSYFTLAAYVDSGLLRYLFFTMVLSLYLLILCANVLLIVVICMNRSLHEPMYVFLCSLFVNELYGSTGLFPLLLLQILSDVHTVPRPLCFLQIFCVYSYACVEFFNLAVMSYDRYLAICCPLKYNTRMTPRKITVLITLTWLLASVVCFVPLTMTAPLQLCGNIINKVYCDNYYIVKLSCSDTTVHSIYGLAATSFVIVSPVLLIFFSYVRILKVCFSGSKQTRQKAVSTCTPHLLSLLNFSFGAFFEIIQSRFNMSNVPNLLRIILSLYWLTCQPLFNPLMYGLNMSRIRNICKNLIIRSRNLRSQSRCSGDKVSLWLSSVAETLSSTSSMRFSSLIAVVDFFFIITSYVVIFSSVMRSGTSGVKALHTCVTHIVVMAVSLTIVLTAFLSYRIRNGLPASVHIFLSVMYMLFPNCFYPIICSVRTSKIRRHIVNMLTLRRCVADLS